MGEAVDGVLVLVRNHNLIAEFRKPAGEVGAEPAHTDDQH